MNATITQETANLVEVAALRVAQENARDERRVAEIVHRLRVAFPEWRDVYGPDVLALVCERFGIPFSNATALYFDSVAA